MELGFDHQALLQSPSFTASRAAELQPAPANRVLDWAGLQARFMAAHALRREMAAQRIATPPGGSFITEGQEVLAWQRKSSQLVNPTDSANVKGVSGIETSVVGNPCPAIEEYHD